jgi:tetratricopeptide (TPR) repeat protein
LEVLDSVADKAAAYLASLSPAERNDTTEFSRERVLRVQSAVRAVQGRTSEAASLLAEAHALASRFVLSHPNDMEALFERGMVESQTATLHWAAADYAAAIDWITRFRDTAATLVAHDPARREWQLELFTARYNLAYFRKDMGELDAAQTEVNAALVIMDQLIASKPGDRDLRLNLATAHELLGGIAELQGNYPEAARHYGARVSELEKLVAEDPKNAVTKQDLAVARVYAAGPATITGRLIDAAGALARAQTELNGLLAIDDQNVLLREYSIIARLATANLTDHAGVHDSALRIANAAIAELEVIAPRVVPDRLALRLQSQAWRQKAESQTALGSSEALASAMRAADFGEKLTESGGANPRKFGECARDHVVLGQILEQAGDHGRAQAAWQRALALLAPRQASSQDWAILDPYARALALLGRGEEARAVIERLQNFGYIPLQPWPSSARAAADSSSDKTHN